MLIIITSMNAFFKNTYTALMAIVAFLLLPPAIGFSWGAAPQNEIQWGDNLKQALELSRQTGKPVLLHFFSDTCPPCKMMEKSTFPNPAITEMVQKSFIPVKLNARKNPREAQMFNVQSVPMDFVLASNGQEILKTMGGQDASRYGHFLATAAKSAKPFMAKNAVAGEKAGTANISGRNINQNPQSPNQPPVSSPYVNAPGQTADSLPPLPEFPAPPSPNFPLPENTPGAGTPPMIEAGGVCPIDETPSFNYAAIPEEEKAMIEFEGYCPVELSKHLMWVRGDYNNRLQFEGRLYLFAGKDQLEEFKRNPEKYAPAYQGIDIVVWKERGEKVHGTRIYGAWAVGRVFLFSSEENLIKFEKNARYYLTPNN